MAKLPLTRRQLLGGGLLLVGGWVLAQGLGHRPMPGVESSFLGSSGRQTLQAALDALLPTPEDAPGMAADVDAFLAEGDPVLGGQLRLALGVLEHVGGAGLFHFQRFSRLDRQRRAGILADWRRSSVGTKRQIADALRRVAFFTYYARPAAWARMGYDGPLVGR